MAKSSAEQELEQGIFNLVISLVKTLEQQGQPEAFARATVSDYLDKLSQGLVTTVEPGRPDVRRIAVGTPGASVRDTKQSRLLAAALKRIAQVERGL
jgi:predicted nucleic acid-binding Zn ribbon protein